MGVKALGTLQLAESAPGPSAGMAPQSGSVSFPPKKVKQDGIKPKRFHLKGDRWRGAQRFEFRARVQVHATLEIQPQIWGEMVVGLQLVKALVLRLPMPFLSRFKARIARPTVVFTSVCITNSGTERRGRSVGLHA